MLSGELRGHQASDDEIDYSFDSRGLHHYAAFLSTDEVEAARRTLGELQLCPESWTPTQHRASSIHNNAFPALAQHLHNHSITRRLVGYPPRLLESYAISRVTGALDLHGGASEFLQCSEIRDISARSWVQDGRLYSLRVKVLVYLDDVEAPEDGQFIYVEGSHKAAFSFHRAFPTGRSAAKHLIRRIDLRAGDAIWLNESLLHGADTKTSGRLRRVLAFTYGPSFMTDWVSLNAATLVSAGYITSDAERRVIDDSTR